MNNKITMIEIFAGIGAQERSIRQLPIQSEIVATMDVDKDAILSYAAMRYDFEKELNNYNFPTKEQMVSELQAKNVGFDFQKGKHTITMKTNEDKVKQYYLADKLSGNLGDVSLCEKLPYSDIVFHSSPCQAFSIAGKGEGGDEGSGTTSSLMWESLRLIGTSKPKYVVWENVSAVLSPKHRHNFIKMLEQLSNMGYESTFDLLNSKHYGIPQNRLRIFCISHLIENENNENSNTIRISDNKQVNETMKEISNNPNIKIWNSFTFPEEIPLVTRLKDVLEKSVDEKYYLSDSVIEKYKDKISIPLKRGYSVDVSSDEVDTTEIDSLGNYSKSDYNATPIVNKNGVAPTVRENHGQVTAILEKSTVVEEPFIVASRGRNPENPSDRTTGAPTEQRLEPNFSGCTNTLTSVQKDNYVCEPQVLRAERTEYGKEIRKQYEAGEIEEKIGNMREMNPRTDGIANTITTVQKDNYIVEPIIYDDYNSRIPQDQDAITTLTTNCGAAAPRNGVKIIEPVVCEERKDEGLRFFKDEVVGTLRTIDACGDKRVLEPEVNQIANVMPGKNRDNPNQGRVYDTEGLAPTLTKMDGGNRQPMVVDDIKWRIRKLTGKECWRLMGFTDEDNERASQYVSASAQYKQAGNSICTSCLVAIFSSLLLENGYKADIWSKYLVDFNE